MVTFSKLQALRNHLLMSDRAAQTLFSAAALARLELCIEASERQHSGEICICVESRLSLSLMCSKLSVEEMLHLRALDLFSALRVWNTEHNNGVLIYVLLVERRIEIVTDRGLNPISPVVWQTMIARWRAIFQEKSVEAGLLLAVADVTAILVKHFALPLGLTNPDELPNALVFK